MALNAAKCTIVLKQGSYGWTESYFRDSPTPDLSAEFVALQALTVKRIACSGKQTFVPYLKVSNENIKRDVRVAYYGELGVSIYVGQSGKDSDFQDTALLVKRFNTNRTSNAPLYMRGIWDECVDLGGQFDPTPAWLANWGAFRGELLNNGWQFVGRDPATPDRKMINSVIQMATKQVGFTLAGNLFNLGQVGQKAKIFASGILGAAAVNGPNIVNVTAQNACNTVKHIPIFDYTSGGFMSQNLPILFPITNVDYFRVLERKVGRPLYQSRGRSPVRKVA